MRKNVSYLFNCIFLASLEICTNKASRLSLIKNYFSNEIREAQSKLSFSKKSVRALMETDKVVEYFLLIGMHLL